MTRTSWRTQLRAPPQVTTPAAQAASSNWTLHPPNAGLALPYRPSRARGRPLFSGTRPRE